MAEVARATGRIDVAEDSVQDACVVAVQQWTAGHVPRDPQAWLTGVARHKALDRLRREARRPAKEAATAALAPGPAAGATGAARSADEDLWLIYLCCHPALSPEARIALTLRAVGGLTTPAPTCSPGWAATTRRPGRTAPRWNWSRPRPNAATSSAA